MSPTSKSKSKDKKASKEPQQKSASKPSVHTTLGNVVPVSGYNPLLGKFHTLDPAPNSSPPPLHINGRYRNIDDTEDHSGNNSLGTGTEYDTISNNGSWSGESEEPKEKTSQNPPRQEAIIPGADNDKREKIRQKNEKKHQRQKEKRAQELHERCSGFLMSRKLEALAQQLVSMGFSSERATMALILNEGKIEESVSWLFEVGEGDNHEKNNLDEGNLKIDISEELARIADMEIRYKCSKQDVERAVVACEGDLDKAVESLGMPKQEIPSSGLPKPEEHLDPPTVNNGVLSIPGNQNLLRVQQKPFPSPSIQQRRDEKDFNYAKPAVGVGVPVELGGKNVQALRKEYKAQPKLDGTKPQQIPVTAADKRWPSGVPNPSLSYSLASSPLQASPALAKTETRYVALGSELKNLQLGSVKEPVVVMQRPQSATLKQTTTTTISISSSSPPGTTSSWYPNGFEVSNPNGLTAHFSTNNSGSNQLYNQLHYHQPPNQQYMPNGGAVETLGASRGNGLWNRMGTSPTLAAASSLGLFSGLGSNGSSGSGSLSPVDWNTGGSTQQFDYTNIDWSLDRNSSMSRSTGLWQQGTTTTTSSMQNNIRSYDPYSPVPNGRTSSRPALVNGSSQSGGGGSGMIAGMQDGVTSGEMSGAGGVSREWSSPFEERDIFSLPRQFVSSPSL